MNQTTPTDPIIIHAREFTDIEVLGLTLWNALQDAGIRDLAQSLLDATLMFEHYTSLLPHAQADRTADQLREQSALNALYRDLVQRAKAVLPAGTGILVELRLVKAGGKVP